MFVSRAASAANRFNMSSTVTIPTSLPPLPSTGTRRTPCVLIRSRTWLESSPSSATTTGARINEPTVVRAGTSPLPSTSTTISRSVMIPSGDGLSSSSTTTRSPVCFLRIRCAATRAVVRGLQHATSSMQKELSCMSASPLITLHQSMRWHVTRAHRGKCVGLPRGGGSPFRGRERITAPETQVIVGVAAGIQYPASMPEGCPPAAPVFVGPVGIEDEPATLHFGVTERNASSARHLGRIQWQVHVLGRVPVQIVDVQGAAACGKASCRIGVGPALGPAPPVTARALEAPGGAYLRLISWAVAPTPVCRVTAVMRLAHQSDAGLRRHALGENETKIRRLRFPLARILPLVGITQTLARGGARGGGRRRRRPGDGGGAGDIGEFKLVDARFGVLGLLRSRVVQRCLISRSADALEPIILIAHTLLLQFCLALLGCEGMSGDGRVALPNDPRAREDRPDFVHLVGPQPMDFLQLLQQLGGAASSRCLRGCRSHPCGRCEAV